MKTRFGFYFATVPLGALAFLALTHVAQAKDSVASTLQIRVDVDRAVLPADTKEKAIVKIALDGVKQPRHGERLPVNLALVIDRSGSMGGDKIAKAREAAIEAVRRLSPDDIVSLIAYDNEAEVLVSARRRGDGETLEAEIARIAPRGSTALYDGVRLGAAEVRRHLASGRYVNRVILLSDGLANVGPKSPRELGRLGAELMEEGISVTTIGLGLGYNEDLMAQLAQRSDGNTYFVENSCDLPEIFAAELGDVLNVIARRVVVEVEFPAGVTPRGFVGREGRIRGRVAELELNQIYGGQEKFALIEVDIDPAKPGTEREIAVARVRYDDAVRQQAATATATRRVQFSRERSAVVQSANHQVQTDYARNTIAVAKDEAIALIDAGQRAQAAQVLRERTDELRKVSEVYRNREMQKVAAEAAPEADRLDRDGLSAAQRKSYRAEIQQTQNQQTYNSTLRR